MTPHDRLEAISMDDVLHAHVGHVVAMLQPAGRRHAAMVDEDAGGHQILRGLLTCYRIAVQLGEPVETVEIGRNFA